MIEGDVTLRVPSRRKDPFGVFDPDDLVPGRVENQEWLSHGRDLLEEVVGPEVVDELLANRKGAPREPHVSLPFGLDLVQVSCEEVRDLIEIRWCGDRHDRPDLFECAGDRQHRRTSERMADQQLRSTSVDS